MRSPVPRILFLDASIGSYPWCGGYSGSATSPHPYEHGRLARDETPYPPSVDQKVKLLVNFIIYIYIFIYLFILHSPFYI